MALWRQTIKAGNTVEVREGSRTETRGGKGKTRQLKTELTSEEQAKINRNRQLRQIIVLINANFGLGDYHISLDYKKDERPEGRTEADANLNRFNRRLVYWYRKQGVELKRIAVTEIGKRGALHHHLVINGGVLSIEKIRALWPFGRIHVTPLEADGDYKDLAEYLIKKTDWEFANVEEMKGKRRFNPSQNLVRPKPKNKRVKRKQINANPKPWKGYYIKPESLYIGKDQWSGQEYMVYRMIRIEPDFKYREKIRKKKH